MPVISSLHRSYSHLSTHIDLGLHTASFFAHNIALMSRLQNLPAELRNAVYDAFTEEDKPTIVVGRDRLDEYPRNLANTCKQFSREIKARFRGAIKRMTLLYDVAGCPKSAEILLVSILGDDFLRTLTHFRFFVPLQPREESCTPVSVGIDVRLENGRPGASAPLWTIKPFRSGLETGLESIVYQEWEELKHDTALNNLARHAGRQSMPHFEDSANDVQLLLDRLSRKGKQSLGADQILCILAALDGGGAVPNRYLQHLVLRSKRVYQYALFDLQNMLAAYEGGSPDFADFARRIT